MGQFTEIYATNVVPSQFWWVAEYGFNGMKHIFIQIFLHVEPHVDYTIQFCGKIYCFEVKIQKIVFYFLYRSRTNYIRLNNLNIKILSKDVT